MTEVFGKSVLVRVGHPGLGLSHRKPCINYYLGYVTYLEIPSQGTHLDNG